MWLLKAFLEEKNKKFAIAAVASGQKSSWNCVEMEILSSHGLVVVVYARKLNQLNFAFILIDWTYSLVK